MNRFKFIRALLGIYFSPALSRDTFYTCCQVNCILEDGILAHQISTMYYNKFFPKICKDKIYVKCLKLGSNYKKLRRSALRKLAWHVLFKGVRV